ncbi:MAG: matrixin family metalloprotease [Bacteroidota bacterium]
MKTYKKVLKGNEAFTLKTESFLPKEEYRHVYNGHIICVTDSKGTPHPDNKSLLELRVDASNGFIPLWDRNVILNWRFNKSFGGFFKDAEAAKAGVRKLLGQAILSWKDACPVKFHEDDDSWDFEIMIHNTDCDNSGCVLAASFFPDQGQHKFYIYQTFFQQSPQEQQETLEHELGHVFGLRHFFANISETTMKSELFGSDSSFSIMNYGAKSKLTPADVRDLKRLYQRVWDNQLTEINGTKIRKFTSYHMSK